MNRGIIVCCPFLVVSWTVCIRYGRYTLSKQCAIGVFGSGGTGTP